MDIDSLKDLLDNFDPSAILPDLSGLTGWVELVARIAVMAGPLLILVLGLLYVFLPAKEANYSYGFRTHRGMASVEAWRFTQKLGGIVWASLGLVLSIVMGILCLGFRDLEVMDMITRAGICLLWEIGLLLLCSIAVAAVVPVFFDREGVRRKSR